MTPFRFFEIRNALGLSQPRLADELGITGRHRGKTIQRYEADPKQRQHRPIPSWLAKRMEQLWDA
jgi:transcriptional regulator with XRE-family HTH domain